MPKRRTRAAFNLQPRLRHLRTLLIALVLLAPACCSEAGTPEPGEAEDTLGRTAAFEAARVYSIPPEDGDSLSGGDVKVVFGLEGMRV